MIKNVQRRHMSKNIAFNTFGGHEGKCKVILDHRFFYYLIRNTRTNTRTHSHAHAHRRVRTPKHTHNLMRKTLKYVTFWRHIDDVVPDGFIGQTTPGISFCSRTDAKLWNSDYNLINSPFKTVGLSAHTICNRLEHCRCFVRARASVCSRAFLFVRFCSLASAGNPDIWAWCQNLT